jgi:transposase InsO family protein
VLRRVITLSIQCIVAPTIVFSEIEPPVGVLHARVLAAGFGFEINVKYEYVYLHAPANGKELWQGIHHYFTRYNYHRPHQSLDYLTPAQVSFQNKEKVQNQ